VLVATPVERRAADLCEKHDEEQTMETW
jgi:hypothetical protein